MLIWAFTGILVYQAIDRLGHLEQLHIDGKMMFFVGCVSLMINILLGYVLQHAHSHLHSHHGQTEAEDEENLIHHHHHYKSMNVRAAWIHVLGDMVQSIGVLIAGAIIWRWPNYTLADPLCTFLFSGLVMITTLSILKDAIQVLMEAAPSHINPEDVSTDLKQIHDGIQHVHDLHIWSLSSGKVALAVHLQIEEPIRISTDELLRDAETLLKNKYDIQHTTIQIEYRVCDEDHHHP
jgi:zinc transporter 2